jgi:hypothetical protein
MDHSSRFILRPVPARNPMMLPQRTMPKITLMATMLGVIEADSLPFLAESALFNSVGSSHASAAKHDPCDEPEKIEWKPKDHRVYAVPKRHGEAHSKKRNAAESECACRWPFHELLLMR